MKYKIIIGITLITIAGFFLFSMFSNKTKSTKINTNKASSEQTKQTDKPQIVSTKPDPLDNNIILPNQVIEISFNMSLQNAPEFKAKIDSVPLKIDLSSDRKTAKITPIKPYDLNKSFTLTIGSDTKFDGVGEWGENKEFHFRTIKYSGI